MRDNRVSILASLGACAATLWLAAAPAGALAAVNYNASKSNTGNLAAHSTRPCCRGAKTKFDLGHGAYAGKRRHAPVAPRHRAPQRFHVTPRGVKQGGYR
jgi:hypothetical protein